MTTKDTTRALAEAASMLADVANIAEAAATLLGSVAHDITEQKSLEDLRKAEQLAMDQLDAKPAPEEPQAPAADNTQDPYVGMTPDEFLQELKRLREKYLLNNAVIRDVLQQHFGGALSNVGAGDRLRLVQLLTKEK